jgi:hypothetical protein
VGPNPSVGSEKYFTVDIKPSIMQLFNKISYLLLRLSLLVIAFAACAAIVNFIAHGNNSNNGANIRTTCLWLVIYSVIFLLRRVFVRAQN